MRRSSSLVGRRPPKPTARVQIPAGAPIYPSHGSLSVLEESLLHQDFEFHDKYPQRHLVRRALKKILFSRSELRELFKRIAEKNTWERIKESHMIDPEALVLGFYVAQKVNPQMRVFLLEKKGISRSCSFLSMNM